MWLFLFITFLLSTFLACLLECESKWLGDSRLVLHNGSNVMVQHERFLNSGTLVVLYLETFLNTGTLPGVMDAGSSHT